MSILAQPKRKVRLSIDPQNVAWKNDEDKFGKRLMEKMGWESGKGLGRNMTGNVNNIKLNANHSGKGFGATANHDTNWIAAHDDFADILKALNKNKTAVDEDESEAAAEERRRRMNMELTSKSVRRRIHYQKFTRAKDLHQYSDKEKAAIMGVKGTTRREEEKETETERETEEDKGKSSAEDEAEIQQSKGGQILTKSALSVSDYFAAKMAAIKAKREGRAEEEEAVTVKAEPKEEETEERDYREEWSETVVKVEVKEEVVEEEEEEQAAEEEDEEEARRRRKREKKERRRREREVAAKESEEATVTEGAEQEAANDTAKEEEEGAVDSEEEARKRRKREKKERKRKEREEAQKRHCEEEADEEKDEIPAKRARFNADFDNEGNAVADEGGKKSKKSRK